MNQLQQKIKTLLPAYFGIVMATGIVSIAAFLNDMPIISSALFYTNLLFMAVLLVMFVFRLVNYPSRVRADFHSYQRAPGFFTLVAALCILGNQFILFYENMVMAETILVISVILWVFLIYGFFFNITVTKNKKSLKDGISGNWLLIIVGIQALSTLISLVSEDFGKEAYFCLFIALCLFLLGCIFYLYLMSLIIYRFSFFPLKAKALGAPYWINMGATAITTLAGSILIMHTKQFHFIVDLLPFLKGFTLFFWAAGTWWIPLLVLLGFWRHLTKKEPIPTSAKGYDPTYWAMVFPLGMYTVCSFRLSEALQIEFLKHIPKLFIYITLFAWGAIMLGFIKHFYTLFHPKKQLKKP